MISIGIFDGVHPGHAAVFNKVTGKAGEIGGDPAVITFWPHPRLVLGKDHDNLKLLTSLEEKIELIESHGIEHLFILPFTKEFAQLPPCTFIKKYLVDGAGLKHLVFGYDHHFGRNREGSFENLKSCSRLYGFTLEQLEPLSRAGLRISSSAIRQALFTGNVKLASRLLSRHYGLQGKIVGGKRIGRSIGYPTANVKPDDDNKLIPADGVYAVRVLMEGKSLMGMMNIGVRPTINDVRDDKSLEVHIIDFTGDIYERSIKIDFIDRIRDEKKFDNIDQLKEQLSRDRLAAIRILQDF